MPKKSSVIHKQEGMQEAAFLLYGLMLLYIHVNFKVISCFILARNVACTYNIK